MLILKEGVSLVGMRPEMLVGLQVIHSIYEQMGADCVVTSALDGKHSRTSLHYVGQALDFRTRDLIESDKAYLLGTAKSSLGPEFDVVLEKTHLHVEFQPKR